MSMMYILADTKLAYKECSPKKLYDIQFTKQKSIHMLRRKIQRCTITEINAAICTGRFRRNLKILNRRASARVSAAYFRAVMNGWATFWRIRSCSTVDRPDICFYGCGAKCDSIEHYAHCEVEPGFAVEPGLYHFFALEGYNSCNRICAQAAFRPGLDVGRLVEASFHRAKVIYIYIYIRSVGHGHVVLYCRFPHFFYVPA